MAALGSTDTPPHVVMALSTVCIGTTSFETILAEHSTTGAKMPPEVIDLLAHFGHRMLKCAMDLQ